MDEEIKKEFEKVWKKIEWLEEKISLEKVMPPPIRELKIQKEKFGGLAGGVRFLIKEKFFGEPKSLKEVIAELKREGYHYSLAGVSSTLSETFTKNQKILNRIKEGKVWKYVIRK